MEATTHLPLLSVQWRMCTFCVPLCVLVKWNMGQMLKKIPVYFFRGEHGVGKRCVHPRLATVPFQALQCSKGWMRGNNSFYVPVRRAPTCCNMSLCAAYVCLHVFVCPPAVHNHAGL